MNPDRSTHARRGGRWHRTVVAATVFIMVAAIGAGSWLFGFRGAHHSAATQLNATTTTQESHSTSFSGDTVVLDPGHNGHNYLDTSFIDHLVWNGREREMCDTTGTASNSGYSEALFNMNVALLTASDLRAAGIRVILTRSNNTGVGPCITQRAAIGNQAHADAVVSIHGDGAPPSGRGFTILTPVADGINNAIIGSSNVLAGDLRYSVLALTNMPISNYGGVNGIQPRNNLAGTNLSTVPKVFIECGNMRNATDAVLMTSSSFQGEMGRAITAGIEQFLQHSDGNARNQMGNAA